MTPSRFRIQKFLGGLRYPAQKDDVLGHARGRGADAQVMRLLDLLPKRPYESPISVSCELGRQAEADARA